MAQAPSYTTEDKQKFIVSLYPAARAASEKTGMSWGLMLAQAAQETGWGEKVLPGTNNIFNIKADPAWQGDSKIFHVWEIDKNGKKDWVDSPFRIYPSIEKSLEDRAHFLHGNPRYTKAGLLDEGVKGDLKREASALQKAGYATDPEYAQKLHDVFHGQTMQNALKKARQLHPEFEPMPAPPAPEQLFPLSPDKQVFIEQARSAVQALHDREPLPFDSRQRDNIALALAHAGWNKGMNAVEHALLNTADNSKISLLNQVGPFDYQYATLDAQTAAKQPAEHSLALLANAPERQQIQHNLEQQRQLDRTMQSPGISMGRM